MMTSFTSDVMILCFIGCLGVFSLDVPWLTSITANAENIREDCSVCGIALRNDSKKARGGTFPENGVIFPWMVSIGWGYSTHNCFGTMIDASHILTAAHCVSDYSEEEPDKIYFRYQPQTGRNDGYAIEKIIIHPRYRLIESDSTGIEIAKYDIALVKLKQRIKCDKHKNPICLPPVGYVFPLGGRNIFTGWKFTNPNTGNRSELLRHGFIRNLKFSECIKGVPESRMIKNHSLCQGGTQHRLCYGDSGGPLIQKINQKYHIVGLASSETNTNCALNKPMIFMDVVKFLNWIQSKKKIATSASRGEKSNMDLFRPLGNNPKVKFDFGFSLGNPWIAK